MPTPGFNTNPILVQDLTPAFLRRFWKRVNKDGPIVRPELGPCWLWTGARNPSGHGHLMLRKKEVKPHRVAWVIARGNIPDGVCILHRCDNPPCVNDAHL